MMKTCYSCKQSLDGDKFSKDSSSRDGLQGECKLCVKRWYDAKHVQPGFVSWLNMKHRVSPRHPNARYYHEKGIRLYEPWRKYEVFIRDVGLPPTPDHTIERMDVDGNYEPGNVKWATMKEQSRNRTSNRFITYNGETLCYEEWGERLGGSHGLIYGRLKRGWTEEQAVSTPLRGAKVGD